MDILSNQGFLKNMFLKDPGTRHQTQIARQCFDLLELIVITVDPKGNITFINKGAGDILDYNDNNLLGKDFVGNLVPYNEQEKIRSYLTGFLNNKSCNTLNILTQLRASDNENRFIDAQFIKISDNHDNLLGTLVCGKDVTGHICRQHDLQNDIDLYRALLNKLPEINVFVFDKDLRFILTEGAEMKIAGFSKDDFLGKTVSEISDKRIKKIWTPLFYQAVRGEDAETEHNIGKNYYLIRVSPLRGIDNDIHYGLAVIRNITSEKKSEKSVPGPKTEIILKNEVSPKPYNLYHLKKMSGNDKAFVNKTIKLFIENSETAVRNFRQMLEEKKWKQIGETAHKILPSYRHLEVDTVIDKLVEIKTRTLIDHQTGEVSKLVEETIDEIEKVTTELQNEISE